MKDKLYQQLFDKYQSFVQNEDIWNKFKNELEIETSLEKILSIETLFKNLGIKIDNQFMEQRGYAHIMNDSEVTISIDFTDPENVRRFTLAHELSHILFDYDRLESGERINNVQVEKELLLDQSEIRANQFAAELLMPQIIVEKELQIIIEEKKFVDNNRNIKLTQDEAIPILAEVFNVSYSTARNRLKSLGMIR